MQQSCQIVTESRHGGGFSGSAKAVQARPVQGCRGGLDGAHPRSHSGRQGQSPPIPMAAAGWDGATLAPMVAAGHRNGATPAPVAAAAGTEPPLLLWQQRVGTQPACSRGGGRRGQESPAYPMGRGDGCMGPPCLSLGLWQRREGGTSPTPRAACREPAPPVAQQSNDSAPRFPLQGLEISENYSHISRP